MRKTRQIEIGTNVNLFSVVAYDEKSRKYILRCECGSESKVNCTYIKQSFTNKNILLGCKNCTKNTKRKHLWLDDFESAKRKVYLRYKSKAEEREYCFELQENEFFKIIQENCIYCGQEPNMELKDSGRNSFDGFKFNGVDRVDNSIGYILGNSVPCCKICNMAKSTLTKTEFFEWTKRVVKHNNLL